jgi:radial spoke head protein 4A
MDGGEPENDEDMETPLPDIMNLEFYFEQAGIGLSREEMFRVFLALKQLVDSKPLQSVRFWGKCIKLDFITLGSSTTGRDVGPFF